MNNEREPEPVDCRIVGVAEFFTLPAGTVYAHWEPCIIGETLVKGDTLFSADGKAIDFVESVLGAELFCGTDGVDYDRVVIDDIGGRWGLYDDEAQFVVYPPAAIRRVIEKLQASLVALGEMS